MARRSAPLSVLTILLLAAWASAGQSQRTHPVSGRRIATVMGHEGAAWLDRQEREQEEAPTKAVAALKLKPGQVVADIGAGSGYYSMLLAPAVGLAGKVYATDIQQEMLTLIRQKLAANGVRNVETVLGTVTDPKLPDGSLDLAVMVDVYHELQQPEVFLRALKRTLKPDGRLVLIEFRKENPRVPIREEHKMTVREARVELEAGGYRFDEVIDVLPWQHIIIFRPR
ncbi:MAG: methyltransferase domain-containing protein [Vicinamibacterales bacterium]